MNNLIRKNTGAEKLTSRPKAHKATSPAARRAENAERISALQHALENVPPELVNTPWQADRQHELDAALAWHERNPAPVTPRPARVKLPGATRDGMEAMLDPSPPELTKVKRTRAMRLPVKARRAR